MALVRAGNIHGELDSEDFKISDSRYGTTLSIYDCTHCGFRQSDSINSLLQHYEDLQDRDYEGGRSVRKKQMANLLLWLGKKYSLAKKNGLSLLDVGAGSGMLVEVAQDMGYLAQGVEPSRWLCNIAHKLNLSVTCGTVEDLDQTASFDVITLIDVIEHVEDPLALLRSCVKLLPDGGILMIVTPDCSSFAARIFGWKWWHYRIAHVSYFTPATLRQATNSAGVVQVACGRPGWRFTLDYLCERAQNYLPRALIPHWSWLGKVAVPINFYDSLAVIAIKQAETEISMY